MEVFFLSLAKMQILYYIGNQFVIKFYSFYDSPYNNFPIDTLNRGVRNSSDWTQIVIKKQFDDHASYIEFGGIMKGRGEAWFDNLEISIDGIPLRDTLQPSPKIRLTRKDKQELRKYLHPIRTVAPDATDTNDQNVL